MSRSTQRGRRGVMLGLAVVATTALLAACGGDDETSTDETTTTETADSTTTTAADTTTGGSGAAADAWTKDAVEYRGQDGTEVKFDCPAGGTLDTIWGTETYTDDSSVCSAAVHVGLITVEDGGKVTIEIQPGQDAYDAGEANGITSLYYGAWDGSFTFPDAPPGSGEFAIVATVSWTQDVAGLEVGDTQTLACPPGGPVDTVWGTGVYTSDSSICTAAVLEGLITVEDGGTVTVKVVAGEDSYAGSEANGITSLDYGSWSLSFEFPEDQPAG